MENSQLAETIIDTAYGEFSTRIFGTPALHCVVVYRKWDGRPFVRLHSQCLFGETFASMHCDCNWQVDYSMLHIGQYGGVLVYMFQEGRGIGLIEKVKAMELEREMQIDTVKAFAALGYPPEARNFELGVEAAISTGVGDSIRLYTGNPAKVTAFVDRGLNVEVIHANSKDVPKRVATRVNRTKEALGHLRPNLFGKLAGK